LTGSYLAGPDAFVGDAAEIARSYTSDIVAHRWGAMLMDGSVSVVVGAPLWLISDSLLGSLIASAVAQLLYFFVLEGRWGVTLGKLVMRIQVVDAYGRAPGYSRSAIRTLLRLVEVNPLLGCIPAGIAALVSRSRQRLGDMLAGTYVLYAPDVLRLRDG
jgi:uncharacterized RDD family membrane protein YckC